MDWLEEYVEKVRQYIKNASMIRTAAAYLVIAMLGSLACTMLTVHITSLWINVMNERISFSSSQMQQIRLLMGVKQVCPYFFMLISIVIVGKYYVENKIKAAVSEIGLSLKHMAAGDLSFEIALQSEDEIGMIAKDMENLRETLKGDKLNQWRMGEEQRKINAAFAHDIRTPLTVMKGYTEFLIKYVPEGKVTEQMLLDKLGRISRQGDRLLCFSKTMTRLQTMEKWEVHCRQIRTSEICSYIKEAAEGIQGEIQILFHDRTKGSESVLVDFGLIMEAVENVLQNAIRYAKEQIEITVQNRNNKLMIYVKDDGEGFSKKALREADTVYFRERKEAEDDEGHFGIGLSITKMLCEKHGGELKLLNSVEGGAVAAVSFCVGD
ncbi:MAG: HAMP domain-containing histidine kinase [Lachnospiraceae bacterium]|nr:HAMP domain-containing histidine kinase [Lachnospiraceae bacterium]